MNRTAIMATVSGTVSEATGGKFTNGAVSGAFVHLFNTESVSSFSRSKLDTFEQRQQEMNSMENNLTADAAKRLIDEQKAPWYHFGLGEVIKSLSKDYIDIHSQRRKDSEEELKKIYP